MNSDANPVIADHGDWLEIDVSSADFPESTMKIDSDDWLSLCEDFPDGWIEATGKSSNVKYARLFNLNGYSTHVHRLLIPKSKMIDHVNHDGLDNRRENIRACTPSQNQMNRRSGKNNTSGTTGVWWRSNRKRWMAELNLDGKRVFSKSFKSKDEAIKARELAKKEYFKDFAIEE